MTRFMMQTRRVILACTLRTQVMHFDITKSCGAPETKTSIRSQRGDFLHHMNLRLGLRTHPSGSSTQWSKARLNHNSQMWFTMMMMITIISVNIWTPLTGRPGVRGQHILPVIRTALPETRLFDLVSAQAFFVCRLPLDPVWPGWRIARRLQCL